jgi:AmpE protein
MSLLSLLIAIAAEKSLSASHWHFDYYYQKYANFFLRENTLKSKTKQSTLKITLFLLLPVAIIYAILSMLGEGLIYFVLSTFILIICLGCFTTRSSYKQYLHATFRGDEAASDLYHQQLLQNKNLPDMGFGQALIWLNYRYYIAIILFFITFGAAGVVFYRLLTTLIEHQNSINTGYDSDKDSNSDNEIDFENEKYSIPSVSSGCKNYHDVLFYLDWLPVRITSFGYMFVGHFSKAMPIWLESLFDVKKPTHEILIDVAEKSEDNMVNENDCSAEPCLLVRLSKRNVLLLLAIIATLTLFGVIR